jgi:hypothetical protein
MRQYRDEHPRISDFQLHPQKHEHRIQRAHTGYRSDGENPGVRPSDELEARTESINKSKSA